MRLAINGRFYAARTTGVQRVARALVEALCRRADVELYLPAGCDPPAAVERRAVSVERGTLRGVAWEQLELPWRTRAGTAGAGAGAATTIRLDPANAGPLAGHPRVMVLHDVLPLTHPEGYRPAFRRWFRWVVGPSARRADAVIMFSHWARDQAIETLGLDPRRVHVLSQGVEPFHRPAGADAVRETLRRLGIDRPFVLAVGAGDPRKNDGFLARVLARMREESGAAPLLVVVGERYGHVHEDAGSDGAPGSVRIEVRRPGMVSDDELRALYTGARAFCFPSRAEGFGRPPLEAMGCGTPVVAADYGCAREVLGDAGVAATILSLDPEPWARALAGLLAEAPEARARRQAAGRAHAARFRWDPAVDALLQVCRQVADRDRAGTAAARSSADAAGVR